MDLFHHLAFLENNFFVIEAYIFKYSLFWEQKFLLWSYIILVSHIIRAIFNFHSNADEHKRRLQSIGETTAKSPENRKKEVDNTKGICSTNNVSIVELIQKVPNGFAGFQLSKIFPEWNETL